MEDGKQRRIDALRKNNPNKIIDIAGMRFGRLVAVERVLHKKGTWWKCKCDCGGEAISLSVSLRRGSTQSCGCLQGERAAEANHGRIKHGHAAGMQDGKRVFTPTYRSWKAMLERCRNPKAPNYHLYGGRGISVCEQWIGKDGFATFLRDVGERTDGKTLDRYPNKDGSYEPGNCRWATPKEQAQNRRELSTESKAKQLECLAMGRGGRSKQ